MRKHHDSPDNATGGTFGKTGPAKRDDRDLKHVDDRDFKKGKSTTEQRGDEDEL